MNPSQWEAMLLATKKSLGFLRTSSEAARNAVLGSLADLILKNQNRILDANRIDLAALPPDSTPAFRDRLTLNSQRLHGIVESIHQIAALTDPIGELVESKILKNGLLTERVRAPLGLIFMIFESRPNVAVEAFSLAIKSGNGLILRGGKESTQTVSVFYDLMKESLTGSQLPSNCLIGITDPDRSIVLHLLQQKKTIDVVVPRGGDSLIAFVTENSKIPLIKNDRGMCHLYAHSKADIQKLIPIIVNAKTQRPGVCNAIETLLIDEAIATEVLPQIESALRPMGITWFGCSKTISILGKGAHVQPATDTSFDTEHLELKLNCRVVENCEEAIEHIEAHGSHHSEAIITEDPKVANQFLQEVDAAVVYWNASTRFTDGFELGLGGELGISTQKLHVRGPVGLRELTSVRWKITGTGQIRG